MTSVLRCGLLLALLLVGPARAEDPDERGLIAPPLFAMQDIVMQWPVFSNADISGSCGIRRDEVIALMQTVFKDENLPVTLVSSARPQRRDVPRVQLQVNVSTLRDAVASCATYLQLKAEAQHTLRLPPLSHRKTVSITYWSQGGLIVSPLAAHSKSVMDGLRQLSRLFAQQWKMDQPPELLDALPAPEPSATVTPAPDIGPGPVSVPQTTLTPDP